MTITRRRLDLIPAPETTMDEPNTDASAPGGYVRIDRAAAQDSRLSLEARGLFVYLRSKPRDWRIVPEDIQREGKIGRDKAYKLLRELLAAGYLERPRVRQSNGTFLWGDYRLRETSAPLPENPEVEPLPEKPDTAEPDTAEPDTANQDSYKKESLTNRRDHKGEREGKTRSARPRSPDPHQESIGALIVYEETKKRPNAQQAIRLANEIPSNQADAFRAHVRGWLERGWSSVNIGGMLDRFRRDPLGGGGATDGQGMGPVLDNTPRNPDRAILRPFSPDGW